MKETKINPNIEEHEGMVPVVISFFYYDLESLLDGEDQGIFWITEDEYKKVEKYNAHPFAHHIGVLRFPRITHMVETMVSHYASNIFFSDIRLAEDEDFDDIWDYGIFSEDDYAVPKDSNEVDRSMLDEDQEKQKKLGHDDSHLYDPLPF